MLADAEKKSTPLCLCLVTSLQGKKNIVWRELASKSFENVAKLKYCICIREETKSGLNLGNAWYRAAQNILSSRTLSLN
jgi:hypothetical protein